MAFAMETDDTEVPAKACRRRFTAGYEQKLLREAEQCRKPGEIAALLRREGLYSSHLTAWRAARASGERAGLEAKRRSSSANAGSSSRSRRAKLASTASSSPREVRALPLVFAPSWEFP